MLPFGGQGSNSAIEDAGALGYLFTGVDNPESVIEQLRLFERARKARASRVQVLSSVRAGREKEAEEELRRYADPPGSSKRLHIYKGRLLTSSRCPNKYDRAHDS